MITVGEYRKRLTEKYYDSKFSEYFMQYNFGNISYETMKSIYGDRFLVGVQNSSRSTENNNSSYINIVKVGNHNTGLSTTIDYEQNQIIEKDDESYNYGVFSMSGGGDVTIGVGRGASSSIYFSTDNQLKFGTSSTYSDTAGFGSSLGIGFDWHKDMNSYSGKAESLEVCAIFACVRMHRSPDNKDLTGFGLSPLTEYGSGSATLHKSETVLHQNNQENNGVENE